MDASELNPALIRPLGGFGTPPKTKSPDQMRQIAQDFEASYLSQMLKPMFEGLSTEAPFGGGAGEEMWRGFLVEAMAKETSKAGGVGLADKVMSHMLKAQEGLV